MLQSVQEYNGLNGVVKRSKLENLQKALNSDQQTYAFNIISGLLKQYPKTKKFDLEVITKVFEQPSKELLSHLEYKQEDENVADLGLAKAVTPSDIYQMITDKMLALIKEASGSGYKKKWQAKAYGKGYLIPFNFESKKRYRGVNVFLLTEFQIIENPYFLTFKQIEKNKGKLKKGSKGYPVVYFTKLYKVKDVQKDIDFGTYNLKTAKAYAKKHGVDQDLIFYLPILKYYNVFNGKDIEGIDFDLDNFKTGYIENELPTAEHTNKLPVPEAIIANYPKPAPKYTYGGDRAFFRVNHPGLIKMPYLVDFETVQDYYRTFFHELSHSTGVKERLNRVFGKRKGDKNYAFEELVAEWGAVFLSAEAGIIYHNNNNHAEYLKNWNGALTHLKDDNKFIMRACTEAQKVADYILQHDENGNPKYLKNIEKITKKVETEKPKEKSSILFEKTDLKSDVSKFTTEELNNFNKEYLKDILWNDDVNEFIKKLRKELLNRKYSKKTKSNTSTTKTQTQTQKAKYTNAKINTLKAKYLDLLSKSAVDRQAKVFLNNLEKKALKNIELKNDFGDFLTGKTSTIALKELLTLVGFDFYNNTHFNAFSTIDSLSIKVNLKPKSVTKPKANQNGQYALLGAKQKKNKGLKLSIQTIAPKSINTKQPKELAKSVEKGFSHTPAPEVKALNNTAKPSAAKYKTAADLDNETKGPVNLYNIQGDLSKFLGKIEIKPVQSLLITLDTEEGGGKTHTFFQWANVFANAGYRPIIWSLEEHKTSEVSKSKSRKYFTPKAYNTIVVESENDGETGQQTYNRLIDSIKDFDVIFIDSLSKLIELNKSINVDQQLRKAFNGKLIFLIKQRTSSGKARGGTKAQFDGDIILKGIVDREDFRNNVIYNHKNRYNEFVPLRSLEYSPYYRKLVGNETAHQESQQQYQNNVTPKLIVKTIE